jgi:cytochrome c553
MSKTESHHNAVAKCIRCHGNGVQRVKKEKKKLSLLYALI